MSNPTIDLTICQDCHVNPAVYGDGLTWSRCSACQLKHQKAEVGEEPKPAKSMELDQPAGVEQTVEHKIIPGLVSIILPVYMVNYTLFHYTGNCIGSIKENTLTGLKNEDPDYELIVVDNGSPIQPPDLNAYYADKVIKNEKNLGVTKAWNQAIRMSQGEYIVLINNDVQVFWMWLRSLKAKCDEGYDLVMAHPMYSLTEPFARGAQAWEAHEGKKKFDDVEKDFSCVMIKRSVFDEIGLFDEAFFNYCQDSDFFRRLEAAGKKWIMSDKVFTSHISDATGFSVPETPELMNIDKATFAQKYPAVEKSVDKMAHPGEQLVRANSTGDSIFLVLKEEKTLHHISSPEVLHALGYEFGEEEIVDDDYLGQFKYSEDITMENISQYA